MIRLDPICARVLAAGLVIAGATLIASMAPAQEAPEIGAPAPNATPTVHWDGGRLWLSAQGVPLGVVLREVARAVGMTLAGTTDLRDPVSLRLDGVPLPEAFRRLLRGLSYVLIDDEGGNRAALRLVGLDGRPPGAGVMASGRGGEPVGPGYPAEPSPVDTMDVPSGPSFASLDDAPTETTDMRWCEGCMRRQVLAT